MEYTTFEKILLNNFNCPRDEIAQLYNFILDNYETNDLDETGICELIDSLL